MGFLFFDPIYRASFLGSCMLCFSAGIMGVFIFLEKRSLLSETLSHAAYPGLALGGAIVALQGSSSRVMFLLGAFFSCAAAMKTLQFLQKKEVPADAAMTLVISGFFAIGTLFTSYLQRKNAALFLQMQNCFFGDVATMLEEHVAFYFLLSLSISCFIYLAYRKLQLQLFDPIYAKCTQLYDKKIERLTTFFLILSIITGIRSCGVVLLSSMLIAPVSAARILTSSLSSLFFLSGLFGLFAALLGSFLSISCAVSTGTGLAYLPVGPLIVLSAAMIVIACHLFAPKQGFFAKCRRRATFRFRTRQENMLKFLWREGKSDLASLQKALPFSFFTLQAFVYYMQREGLIKKQGKVLSLTKEGNKKARRIIRFHRLWEVYLTRQMHICAKKVHGSAEEMEHIITPEMEKRLETILEKPQFDPHQKPIPKKFS